MKKILELIAMILWYPIGIVLSVFLYIIVFIISVCRWLKNRRKNE